MNKQRREGPGSAPAVPVGTVKQEFTATLTTGSFTQAAPNTGGGNLRGHNGTSSTKTP